MSRRWLWTPSGVRAAGAAGEVHERTAGFNSASPPLGGEPWRGASPREDRAPARWATTARTATDPGTDQGPEGGAPRVASAVRRADAMRARAPRGATAVLGGKPLKGDANPTGVAGMKQGWQARTRSCVAKRVRIPVGGVVVRGWTPGHRLRSFAVRRACVPHRRSRRGNAAASRSACSLVRFGFGRDAAVARPALAR